MHLLVHVYVLQLPVPQMLPSRYKVALRLGVPVQVHVDLEILDSNKYCKNIEGYRVHVQL